MLAGNEEPSRAFASVPIEARLLEESAAAHNGRNKVQLWVGDPETDARVCLGRVQAVAGAAITIPLIALKSLGAADVHAV